MLSKADKNGPVPQPHMAALPKRTISQGFIGSQGSKTFKNYVYVNGKMDENGDKPWGIWG